MAIPPSLPSTEQWTIQVRAFPSYQTTDGSPVNWLYMYFERAPDAAGSPATSDISIVASLYVAQPTTYIDFTDYLVNDGERLHYRAFQFRNKPKAKGDKTGWVSAKPSGLAAP